MQVTVATARAVMRREGIASRQIDDHWLAVPGNGIRAGTAYLALQAEGELCNIATMFDPPVAFAAYNAGGVYRMGGRKNRWKMKQYPARSGKHIDRAVKYFNDAVAALKHHSLPPSNGYQ
jgi:soluble lytic murein transglycosylase-like protein